MDLPALSHLGYALNLTDITPFDIAAVASYVLRGVRLLKIDLNDVRNVIIDGRTYSVPRDISVSTNGQVTPGEYVSFPNGRDAASAFVGSDRYALQHFAVLGPTSVADAAEKSFLHGRQYAFFSYSERSYIASLPDYNRLLDERTLSVWLSGVPKQFNSSEATVQKFKEFFSSYGSHVIQGTNFGGQYSLKGWASNESPQVNNMFDTDVKAKFNGIPSGGIFDATVKNQDQYKRFSAYFQYDLPISGGGDSSNLVNANGTYSEYQAWINSIRQYTAGLLSFQVIDIWTLLASSGNSELRSYADPLQDAFRYLVGTPEVYRTAVTLDIQSDWGAFELLTPSAVIVPDPANPYPTNTVANDTRVQWGKEYSYSFDRKTLRFYVVNDGVPIDFSTSHGSLSSGSSNGKAYLLMEGRSYNNDQITDDVWNALRFYKAPVSGNPVRRYTNKADGPFHKWRDVLQDYLHESR